MKTDRLKSQEAFLNKKHKAIVRQKEREIKDLDSIYKAKANQVKVDGEKNILDLHDATKREESHVLKRHQDSLSRSKEITAETARTLEGERQRLKQFHQQKHDSISLNAAQRDKGLLSETRERSTDIREKTVDEIQKLDRQSNEIIKEKGRVAQTRANNLSYKQDQNMRALKDRQESEKSLQKIKHMESVSNLKLEQDKEKEQLRNQHFYFKKQRGKTYTKELAAQKEHFEAIKEGQKEAYKNKLNQMHLEHTNHVTELHKKFDDTIRSINSKHKTVKGAIATRSDDSFYQLKELAPELTRRADDYLVSLDIAEYEKENVKVSVENREVRIHLSRRFENRLESPTGEVDKSFRSEVMTKTLKVPDILTNKDMQRSYQDGKLVIKILKA